MKYQIHAIHFDIDQKLEEHIEKKIDKIKTFYDQLVEVEVYLKLEGNSHAVKDKVAEIKVHIPQHSFFAKNADLTFEAAFEHCYEAMVSQIKRHKEKMAS